MPKSGRQRQSLPKVEESIIITTPNRNAVCNTCTVRLVNVAYQRAPWFRLVREPLRLSMRTLAWLYRIDPTKYEVRTSGCYGCVRFYKTALKERSRLFRWLNDLINPVFDRVLERIVTEEEVTSAKTYAQLAIQGKIKPEESVEKPPE